MCQPIRSILSKLVVCSFLVGLLASGRAEAQIRAMPPYEASADASVVESAEIDGPLLVMEDFEADPVQIDPCPSDVFAKANPDSHTWQILPDGLMYPAYLAAGRESRMAGQWVYRDGDGWLLEASLGGRVGLLRKGTSDAVLPLGWQFDVEGAAFPRFDLERSRDLVSTDYRVGALLSRRKQWWAIGWWETKIGYYHISSHLGDEFLETFPRPRINYARDAVVLGAAWRPLAEWRIYTEAGFAFHTDGGSLPWEFQFGVDYSPVEVTGLWPVPFFAVNGRIRQEVDYGGNFTAQAGCQWRSATGRLFRIGVRYFNGKSDSYQFFTEHEELIGLGAWYDY